MDIPLVDTEIVRESLDGMFCPSFQKTLLFLAEIVRYADLGIPHDFRVGFRIVSLAPYVFCERTRSHGKLILELVHKGGK